MSVSFSLRITGHQAVALGLTSILQYKGRVLDAMSDSVARLRQSVKPEDRTLFEQFAEVAQQLSTLTFQGPGNLSPEAYRKRLDELAQQQETLEAELSNRSAEFRQQVTPITLDGVRQADSPPMPCWWNGSATEPFDPKAKGQEGEVGQAPLRCLCAQARRRTGRNRYRRSGGDRKPWCWTFERR